MTDWHPADIKAAVEKKGTNLAELSRESGLSPAACRNALRARNIPGEIAIAERIDVPLWELWPNRWAAPETDGGEPVRIDHRRKTGTEAA